MTTEETQAPLVDIRRSALEHYERLSSECCDFSSFVKEAILNYDPEIASRLATLEKRIEDAPEGIVAESNGSLAVVRTIELKQGDIKSGTQVKLLEDKDK